MPKRGRILIISASIGGGHVAAGRAVEQALAEYAAGESPATSPAEIETHHIDMLDYTTGPFRRLYRQAYFELVRTAPDLIDWLGRRLDRSVAQAGPVRSRWQRILSRLVRLISFHLPRLIARYQPDVLLHTHFLPPQILAKEALVIPQAVVITDFFAHAVWIQPRVARYFVATDEVRVHLEASGVDPDTIEVTGIPIDLRYGRLEPRNQARAALDLPRDRDVLLVLASGLDRRPLLELLAQLRDFRWPLSTVVVCGRSDELLDVVKGAVAESEGLVHFQVYGFTTELPRMMAAADLLVGKPGGLTSSEALAAGLPFAIVQPYPIQEEANANYLLEHGAAMRIEPLSTFSLKLRQFLENEERRQAMREAALRLARPDAARQVASSLLDFLPQVPAPEEGTAS